MLCSMSEGASPKRNSRACTDLPEAVVEKPTLKLTSGGRMYGLDFLKNVDGFMRLCPELGAWCGNSTRDVRLHNPNLNARVSQATSPQLC